MKADASGKSLPQALSQSALASSRPTAASFGPTESVEDTQLSEPGAVRKKKMTATRGEVPHEHVEAALGAGRDALLRMQSVEGWWKGELETNVTIDAEDLLLRQFLGIRTEVQTDTTATWIRSRQRDDGTWAKYAGGPPDLSSTVEAYLALRLAGDPPDAAHMRAATSFVCAAGGLGATRVFTRIWLALSGLWEWEKLPVLPPEIVLLPRFVPLNVYDFACWARQTIVAVSVVGAHRPARPLPMDLAELVVASGGASKPPVSVRTWAGRFELLDRALHHYERHPVRSLRRLALARAERWIIERQEADGSWGGIQPPWVYSLMALHLQGYALDDPVMRAGFEGLERFTIADASGRRIEACQSPVWDTALALNALSDAGVEATDPAISKAEAWLVREEISVRGDWAVRRPDLAPGGWAFEFHNDHYPDIDDTAEVLLALSRVHSAPEPSGLRAAGNATYRPSTTESEDAISRGVAWVLGMQSRDGGWAAFDADNTRTLCTELSFCDFGELIDPPSADVTAHVVEMLATFGRRGVALDRGVAWLLDAQEDDGSWFGRWGANYVYGTGHVVPALVSAGLPVGHPAIRRAVVWLEKHQNVDGGWGEDLRSYEDVSWRGRGESTPSQTAWALLALIAVGERSQVMSHGVQWLVEAQSSDGTWDEPQFTGTGFPGDFYINYHLYRQVFPVMALGRYLRSRGATDG